MKHPVGQYLLLNIILCAAVFFGLDFFKETFACINIKSAFFNMNAVMVSYTLIALASLFVFFGVYVLFRLGVVKFLIVYLCFTILKNVFLLVFVFKNRVFFKETVIFCLISYFILLFLEVVFILKSIKYEENKKNVR